MTLIARVAAALLVTLTACDTLPFIGKKAQPAAPDTTQVAAVSPDTAAPSPPAPVAVAPARMVRPAMDEPWTPIDTGTVMPGMSREQVITVWGIPEAERVTGSRGYLYFRNGCEVSCGTFDVVLLENGQVVDAIVRGPGHNYAGTSSSPPGRAATPTVPQTPGTGDAA